MFLGASVAPSYPLCKHGYYEFDCETCNFQRRREWAIEEALMAVEEIKRDMLQYGDSEVVYYVKRLEEVLKEMEV